VLSAGDQQQRPVGRPDDGIDSVLRGELAVVGLRDA